MDALMPEALSYTQSGTSGGCPLLTRKTDSRAPQRELQKKVVLELHHQIASVALTSRRIPILHRVPAIFARLIPTGTPIFIE